MTYVLSAKKPSESLVLLPRLKLKVVVVKEARMALISHCPESRSSPVFGQANVISP